MKKIFYSLLLGLSLYANAQVQDISKLSTGVHEQTKILSDANGNVIGYVCFFNKGLAKDGVSQQREFILLNNNLTKITNGDYQMQRFKNLETATTSVTFKNQKLYIVDDVENQKYGSSLGQVLTQFDLKNNQVSSQNFVSIDGVKKDFKFEELSKIKLTKYPYGNYTTILRTLQGNNEPYIIDYRYLNYTYYATLPMKSLRFYDTNFNQTFEFELTDQKRKDGISFVIKSIDENKVVLWQRKVLNNKIGLDHLYTYDFIKGELINDIIYNSMGTNGDEYVIPNVEFRDNKMSVIGDIKLMDKGSLININNRPSLGLKRGILSEKGDTILAKSIYYNQIFKEEQFKKGVDKDGYRYDLTEYFNYSDGGFTVLLEKQKGDGYNTTIKSYDYVLANFDKDGELISSKTIERSKNKFETYMFSQENKDTDEVLFFYQEPVKEEGKKKYNLVINKLNKGVLTQERMPFSTDSSHLGFSRAKYGYILITEYNKDEEESSIRLEKINL